MVGYDFNGVIKRFQVLAVRAASGEDVKADLAALVALVAQTTHVVAPPAAWQNEVERVRGRLRVTLHSMEIPEPALPDKLTDPANQRQRVFYTEAVAQLTALITEVG